MISASDHENAVLLINEAIASGASCKKACWTVWIVNFNTSHVTVYPVVCCDVATAEIVFQYISCYGLSNKLNFMVKCKYHFNTSHVTVYQKRTSKLKEIEKFQYISCYGLSNDFKPFLFWHLSSFPLFYVISAFFTSRL